MQSMPFLTSLVSVSRGNDIHRAPFQVDEQRLQLAAGNTCCLLDDSVDSAAYIS